ncbi:ABC transporter permease [Alkalibacter rhizosphaerae]|uniref:ABC transporter permease n=1 Tax=Alkalibacter rhizosphaerae TaxID=2815577 RepID=A0A975AI96_9FIRM|nr:ABC transporter permease [Alkalibacter rhizosphaerae]QSX08843.1 ABC transporter permease [Alkalibacter rhizosphaerae]
MAKLWTTFLKDAKLSFQGLYFYIEIGLALIFIAVMLFVVPENFDQNQKAFIFANVDESVLDQLSDEWSEVDPSYFVDSRKDLEAALEEDRSAVGVELRQEDGKLVFDFVLQGHESPAMKNLLKGTLEASFLTQIPGFDTQVEESVLEPDAKRLSDRENVLPIYLTVNMGLMGLFIIAAYIFLDKDEGVIKAYAVAPVRIWQYLASKVMIMMLMGILTSLLVVVALTGFKVNFILLLGLIVAFNFFGSALGLLLSSFFDSMTKAMGALYAAVMIMILPVISYFAPSFNPVWIRFFPTYPMMFSFRSLLLEDTNLAYMGMNIGLFLVLGVLLFIAAAARFKKSLTV